MITIKAGTATLTVREENAEMYRAIIDKATGPRGKWPKQANQKGQAKYSSTRRDYPVMHPNMTTGQYIKQYQELNGRLCLSKAHDIDAYPNLAAKLDPSIPECFGPELCE